MEGASSSSGGSGVCVVHCEGGAHTSLLDPTTHDSHMPDNHSDSFMDDLFAQETELITECEGEACNTAATLRYCRRRILTPRDVIFSLFGLRRWNVEGAYQTVCLKLFNAGYLLLLLLCLCAGPVLQYNVCLRRDEGIENDDLNHSKNFTLGTGEHQHEWCAGSLLFVYVTPSCLLLLAYLVTCLVLRCGESEHLQVLLERVYLLASCSAWEVKQRRLSHVLVGWLVVGALLLVLSLTSLILHLSAASTINYTIIEPQSDTGRLVLDGVLVGTVWLGDVVLVLAVLLYCSQCHLLSRLLDIICTALCQGSTSLLAIKKQVDESSVFVRHLNRELGLSVGLCLCVAVFRALTAAHASFTLLTNYFFTQGNTVLLGKAVGVRGDGVVLPPPDTPQAWLHILAVLTNFLPWTLLSVLPLFMAARVTSDYQALRKAGCELQGRPFGYQSTPQQDLDSFLLYVSSLQLQARVLWVPIRTHYLVGLLLLIVMFFLTWAYIYS